MILLENVSFSFKDGELLHDVNMEVQDGQFVGLIGANGAGKTTLIRLMLGLLKPTSGKVTIDDENIAYVSQTTSLNDGSFPATVEEVVGLGLTKMAPSIFSVRKNKRIIDETLAEFGLIDLRHRLVSELSGGQLQRVKIAKALISNPSLIVLDEPDAGMDHDSHDKLLESIKELHGKKGKTVVFISHHLHDLEDADRVFQVKGGTVSLFEGGDEHAAL